MELNTNSFLGRGWSFPPTFDSEIGAINMVEDVQDIQESLHILLSTSLGERVMQSNYGCNLKDYQFEPVNNALLSFLEDLIQNAILYFEPRILLESIEITQPEDFELIEGKLRIELEYSIPTVNSRYNYVFDYYLREADQPIQLNT